MDDAACILSEHFWTGLPFSLSSNIFYKNESFDAHEHSYYEFFMVVEGALLHTMNGERSLMARRSICFLNPEDAHELQNSNSTGQVHIINCTFSKIFYFDTVSMLRHDLEQVPESFSGTVSNLPSSLWEGLVKLANLIQFHRGEYSPGALRTMFRGLCLEVLLVMAEKPGVSGGEVPGWLVKAREKMMFEENYISGLKRFIELAGRTQEHLTRSMKKYYDESPTAFINQLRVRKAARLLLSSQQEIWEIMYECGFNSHAYFLKCFRKSFGMSPRQYIKVNRRVFNIR